MKGLRHGNLSSGNTAHVDCPLVLNRQFRLNTCRAQELCEGRGGRPGLPVHNSPYGLRGRKATLNLNLTWSHTELRSCVTVEVAVYNSPYDLCGRKATLNSGAV